MDSRDQEAMDIDLAEYITSERLKSRKEFAKELILLFSRGIKYTPPFELDGSYAEGITWVQDSNGEQTTDDFSDLLNALYKEIE